MLKFAQTAILLAALFFAATTVSAQEAIKSTIGEMNNFEMSQDFQLQWPYMGYYAHGGISQGYTQKGQILGVGTGYFGTSEFLGLRMYWKRGSAMVYYHRHAPDDNYVYNKAVGMAVPEDYEELQKYWAHSKAFKTFGIEGSFLLQKSLISMPYLILFG